MLCLDFVSCAHCGEQDLPGIDDIYELRADLADRARRALALMDSDPKGARAVLLSLLRVLDVLEVAKGADGRYRDLRETEADPEYPRGE